MNQTSPAEYEQWIVRLNRTISALAARVPRIDWRLEIGPPATVGAVAKVEAQMGHRLPESLRKTLIEFSARFEFYWFIRDAELSAPFSHITHGVCSWDLEELGQLEQGRLKWLELSTGPEDPFDVFRDKLLAMSVANGDGIAIDLSGPNAGSVSYISCKFDDEPFHQQILGADFQDFMERWTSLGCVGPEPWQLSEFWGSNDDASGANLWRRFLGLTNEVL